MLKITNLRKTFNPGTVNEKTALDGLNLHIKEGDPLELFVDGEYVCFKKYNTTELFAEALEDLADLMNDKELSECLSDEEKALIQSTIDFLKAKWAKEKQEENSRPTLT